jgi:DNA-binding CsgD family transcriptional regulator
MTANGDRNGPTAAKTVREMTSQSGRPGPRPAHPPPETESPRAAQVQRGQPDSTTAEAGLVLLDGTMAVVALDEGAALLLPDDPERMSGAGRSLPLELETTLRRNKDARTSQQKLRFRLPAGVFEFRVHVLNFTEVPGPRPILAVHFVKGASEYDMLSEAGARYHLTDREKEALKGIAIGLTSKDLAARMGISPNTVKAFVRIIMAKMGVSTRSGIVARLLEHNNGR